MTHLATHVVAFHLCQSDVASSCHVPECVHSLAAQLSQSPQLSPYHQLLQQDHQRVQQLSKESCSIDPSKAFLQGVLDPLNELSSSGKLTLGLGIIVVDGVCEAQHHRPDYGDTIASFLLKHVNTFPPWLKIVLTIRSSSADILHNLQLKTIRYLVL